MLLNLHLFRSFINNIEPGLRRVIGAWGENAPAFINILAINVEGIRMKHKRLALEEKLLERHIDICIVSESHLRKADLKRITFENYTIVADYCRKTRTQIGGGVVIMVRNTVTAEEKVTPICTSLSH